MPRSELVSRRTRGALAVAVLASAACGAGKVRDGVTGGPGSTIRLDAAVDTARADAGGAGAAGGGADAGPAASCPPPPGASQACGTCEARECTTPDFIGDINEGTGIGQGIDWYGDCYRTQGTAADGPAYGQKKSDLCQAVVDCVHRTNCSVTDDSCYCGAGVEGIDCVKPGVAHGPCKPEIERASETTDPQKIATRRTDNSYAAGAALGLVYYCDYPALGTLFPGPCTPACYRTPGAGCGDSADGGADAPLADAGGGGLGGGSGGQGAGAGGAGGHDAGAGGTGGAACTVRYAFSDGCASCQLASTAKLCDPTRLSAQLVKDDDGNLFPVGFGPDTLPTAAQRDAAYALAHKVLQLGCASNAMNAYRAADMPGCETAASDPCAYPNLGCLLELGQAPSNLSSGHFSADPRFSALAEYRAAAIADATAGPLSPDTPEGYWGLPGGVAPGVSDSALGAYINVAAIKPTSALGMVDNVIKCGLNAGCADCRQLVVTTVCPDGGVTGAGGATGTGAGGATGTGAGGATGTGGVAASGASGGAGAGGAAGAVGGRGGASAGGCPDLEADGVADCRQTLVANPGFGADAAGWSPGAGAAATWSSLDGTGDAASGSLALANLATGGVDPASGWVLAGVSQCLSVSAGTSYQAAAQAQLRPGPASGWAGFILDYFAAPACAGPPSPRPFLSPRIATVGTWQTVTGTTTQVPIGVASIAVRLVVGKAPGQGQLEALFDNVLVRRAP